MAINTDIKERTPLPVSSKFSSPELSSPELSKLKQDLQSSVEVIVKDFSVKLADYASKNMNLPPTRGGDQSSAIPAGNSNSNGSNGSYAPKYKNLPWFKHGIKHFINKLWHGDHPSNPSWQGVQRIEHRLSLNEYVAIKQDIADFCFNGHIFI